MCTLPPTLGCNIRRRMVHLLFMTTMLCFELGLPVSCLPLPQSHRTAPPYTCQVGNKYAWWTGIMFLTNVFFIPFLALRAAPEPDAGDDAAPSSRPTPSSSLSAAAAVAEQPPQYAGWMRAAAAVALGVGVFSLGWAAWGRPEYGDLGDRWVDADLWCTSRDQSLGRLELTACSLCLVGATVSATCSEQPSFIA
jgi:hypothetical protein